MKSYKASCIKENFKYTERLKNGRYVIRWSPIEQEDNIVIYNETTLDKLPTYENVVELLLRERYSINDELALSRQRDEKAEEWQTFYNYCEDCKSIAKTILNIN